MSLDGGMLDQVTQQFLFVFKRDAHQISAIAMRLFYYLAIIQLTLTALWMTLAGESLNSLLTRLTQLVFSFGFFYACISLGSTWIPHIINGFINVGQTAGVQSIDPSSIVEQGVSVASSILHAFFNWGLMKHPFVALLSAFVCIAIIIIYGLLAAELTIILVKTYALISFSGIFFAFGASDFTRAMSRNYMQAVIGIGLQLMTMYFLMGVGQHIGDQWAQMISIATNTHEVTPMFVVLASVIVFYLIVKNVPAYIAGLSGVGGFMNYGEMAVGAAMSSGMSSIQALRSSANVAGGALQGAAGIGKAVSLAYQATSPSAQSTRVAKFMSHSAQATSQLAQAAVQSFKQRQTHRHMNFSQKMNVNLSRAVRKNQHTVR